MSLPVAALLLYGFGFGFVVAATLMPDAAAMAGEGSNDMCDVSRVGFAPVEDLIRVNNTSLNVLLFLPLGVAVALLPRTRAAAMGMVMGTLARPLLAIVPGSHG